jgi:hypothetical protein
MEHLFQHVGVSIVQQSPVAKACKKRNRLDFASVGACQFRFKLPVQRLPNDVTLLHFL